MYVNYVLYNDAIYTYLYKHIYIMLNEGGKGIKGRYIIECFIIHLILLAVLKVNRQFPNLHIFSTRDL